MDEIASERASKGVRTDAGTVLSGGCARTAASVSVLALRAAGTRDGTYSRLESHTLDHPPDVIGGQGSSMRRWKKGRMRSHVAKIEPHLTAQTAARLWQ